MVRHVRLALAALAVAGALVARPVAAGAQEMDVPVPLQADLMTRVIAFDRNAPVPGPLRIAIVYQKGNRASASATKQMARALAGAMSGDRPIEVVRIDIDSVALTPALQAQRPFAAYVAPVRAVDLANVVACLRAVRVRSFSGVTAYVRDGIAVGMSARGSRPRLLINLPASRAEGAEYSSDLLQLAEVIP
jgi:hypothetical protein